MKKYMFIVPSFSSGGAERAVSNLSSQMAIDGYDVTVVIYFSMPDEYKVDKKVKIINLSGGDETSYNKIPYLKKVLMLRKIINREDPDYILPFLPQVTIHATIAACDKKNRLIHTVRNNPAVTPPGKIKRSICNYIVCHSAKAIVQNKKQRSFFPIKFQKNMFVLFNPVSQELIELHRAYSDNPTNILAVGRLEEQKNFQMLIMAIKQISADFPNLNVNIYGEGSERDKLLDLIRKLELDNIVHLRGRSLDMKKVYSEADIFVLSSNYEGMPNTLIEAMATGLPCISTNCETGPSDLIESEKNGILIPVDDKVACAKAISKLLADSSYARLIGQNAKKTVIEKCSISVITKKLREICEGTCKWE